MSEWQPIETAPKDGTLVDLWVVAHLPPAPDEGYRITDARWTTRWVREIEDGDYAGQDSEIEWSVKADVPETHWHHWSNEMDSGWTATHWMPLPAPPK